MVVILDVFHKKYNNLSILNPIKYIVKQLNYIIGDDSLSYIFNIQKITQ
jgi:hypothetical protein